MWKMDKKEGLGGRKINWVIGIKWRRIIQISTIVAVLFSLCTMERMVHSRCGKRLVIWRVASDTGEKNTRL